MKKERTEKTDDLNIAEKDIYEAMKRIPGYLDITPRDFKEVYTLAYKHASKRILESIKARDMMTSPVFSVEKGTTLTEVAALMANKRISGVPVVDTNRFIVGAISEKDFNVFLGLEKSSTLMELTLKYLKGECVNLNMMGKIASDIMSVPAITVLSDTSLGEITQLFARKKINRVFVINEDKKPLGIVTRHDIIQTPLLGV